MPKITFPTIDLIRDYFDDHNLGKTIIAKLEGTEMGSVIGNDGYYYEHKITDEQLAEPGTVYSVINNQRDIYPVQYFGIDIPVLLKSTSKIPVKETIVIIGQDPLRSEDNIGEEYKEGSINIIHEGTPYAIEIDTVNTKGRTANLECYRPIISKLLENYNVYLTDTLKCWIGDSSGKNKSYDKLISKLSNMSQKTPKWLLEQEIASLENGNNTLNEKYEVSFVACLGDNAYDKAKTLHIGKVIHWANHPSQANPRKYPGDDKVGFIVKEILGTVTEEENEEYLKLNPKAKNHTLSLKGIIQNKVSASSSIQKNTNSIKNETRDKLISKGIITNKCDESIYINSILDKTNQKKSLVKYTLLNDGIGINVYWNIAETVHNEDLMNRILEVNGKKKSPKTMANTDESATTRCLICSYQGNTSDQIVDAVIDFENKLKNKLAET